MDFRACFKRTQSFVRILEMKSEAHAVSWRVYAWDFLERGWLHCITMGRYDRGRFHYGIGLATQAASGSLKRMCFVWIEWTWFGPWASENGFRIWRWTRQKALWVFFKLRMSRLRLKLMYAVSRGWCIRDVDGIFFGCLTKWLNANGVLVNAFSERGFKRNSAVVVTK